MGKEVKTPKNAAGGAVGGGTPPAFPWRNRPPTPRKLMDHRRFRTGHRGSFGNPPPLPPPYAPPYPPPLPPPHPTPLPPPNPPSTGTANKIQTPNLKLVLLRGRRLEPEALKSGPRAARGPGRSPRRTKALALRGERPSRRPRPKLLQIRAGPFGRPPKRHPRGCNTRWCEKHENLVKTMGFYEKPRPQNTRSTPLNPHGRASSALAFHMRRAPGRNHVFQGLGGYRKPKTRRAS